MLLNVKPESGNEVVISVPGSFLSAYCSSLH